MGSGHVSSSHLSYTSVNINSDRAICLSIGADVHLPPNHLIRSCRSDTWRDKQYSELHKPANFLVDPQCAAAIRERKLVNVNFVLARVKPLSDMNGRPGKPTHNRTSPLNVSGEKPKPRSRKAKPQSERSRLSASDIDIHPRISPAII